MTTMVPPRPGPDSKCDSIVCYPGYELITEGSPDGCPYCQMIAGNSVDLNKNYLIKINYLNSD